MAGPPGTSTPRSCAACFVHKLTLSIVLLFVILMVIIGIAWLALHPHAPTFRVNSLSVSNFTVTDSQLSGKYNIVLAIKNPNKKIQVLIDHFYVLVFYDKVRLANLAVQYPIFVEKMGQNNSKAELAGRDSLNSGLKTVSDELGKEWSKGLVQFNVKMSARVTYRAGNWPSKLELLKVNCYDLVVEFHSAKSTGKLRGTGKDCDVSLE